MKIGEAWARLVKAAACITVTLAAVCLHADAQDAYPSRPVLLTHGFAAGGNGDVVSRIIADALSPRLGQPVIVEPQLRSGNVRALGVTSATRWWSLPDIVPIAETVPGYDVRTWLGLAAPKGTPASVVARLNAALRSGLADPQVAERLPKIGMDVHASSPEEMRELVAS